MRVQVEKRLEPSAFYRAAAPLIALGCTMIVASAMFALLGKSPLAAFHALFLAPLQQVWAIHDLLVKATPLILIAVGLCVCFRSGNWNIGAEGQFLIGGTAGAALPVLLPDWGGWSLLPAMLLLSVVGGALYALIPALLKTRFGTNEILTSLMLVYVAQLLVDWLVRGPWRDPGGFGFAGTIGFPGDALLPALLTAGTYAGSTHAGIVLAVSAAMVVGFALAYTLKGFEVSVLGASRKAAAFAGFNANRMTIFAFLLSGSLAGLAGLIEVSGNIGKLDDNLSLGYGFTAIIVAFLGRLNPVGAIAAGLLLALTYIGGQEAQIMLGISDKIVSVFQGLLLFFVLAADSLIHYRVRLRSTVPQVA